MREESQTPTFYFLVLSLLHPHTRKTFLSKQCPFCGCVRVFAQCQCNKQSVFDNVEWYNIWRKLYSLHNGEDVHLSSAGNILRKTPSFRPQLSPSLSIYKAGIHGEPSKNSSSVETFLPHLPSKRESQVFQYGRCSCYVCLLYQTKEELSPKQDCSLRILTPCTSCGSSVLCPCRARWSDLYVKQRTPAWRVKHRGTRILSSNRIFSGFGFTFLGIKGKSLNSPGSQINSKCYQNSVHLRTLQDSFQKGDLAEKTNTCIGFGEKSCILSQGILCKIYIALMALRYTHPYWHHSIIRGSSCETHNGPSCTHLWSRANLFCCGRNDWKSRTGCRSAPCSCITWLWRRQWKHSEISSYREIHTEPDHESRSDVFSHEGSIGAGCCRVNAQKLSTDPSPQESAWGCSEEHAFDFSIQKCASIGTMTGLCSWSKVRRWSLGSRKMIYFRMLGSEYDGSLITQTFILYPVGSFFD